MLGWAPTKGIRRAVLSGGAGMTMLLAASALMVLAGTAYAQAATLDGARYDPNDNVLTLNFTGRINPFTVDMTKITVADASCTLTFTWQEYDRPGQDRLSITINPNEAHRETLAKMNQPAVRVSEGAFIALEDGIALGPAAVWLEVAGTTRGDSAPCVITYGFNSLLLDVYATNSAETMQAIHGGFEVWTELNPEFEFARTDDPSPFIWINLDEYHHTHVGLACVDCLTNGAEIDITLYDYDCRNARVPYTPEYIRLVMAHEFGHIIGLGHHTNKTHLMYGFEDESALDPFPTLGYAIPDITYEWRLVGERELVEELRSVNATIREAEAAYDRFFDRYGDRRSDGVYFETQNQVNKAKRLQKEYNNLIDEYNGVVGELNCMRDIPPPGATIKVCPVPATTTPDGQPAGCRDVPARTSIVVCSTPPSYDDEVCEPVRVPPTSGTCSVTVMEAPDGAIESVAYTCEPGWW